MDWPYGYNRDGSRRIPKYEEEGCYQSEYEGGYEDGTNRRGNQETIRVDESDVCDAESNKEEQ